MIPEEKINQNEALFVSLLYMFQVAAMRQLGKIADPASGKVERDLEQAKASIDMLIMLREKTKSNLSKEESRMLDSIIQNLQLNYIDELDRPTPSPDQTPKANTAAEQKPEDKTVQ